MAKIMQKGRLFGVVSIIDILVILAILVFTVGIYMRFFVLEKTSLNLSTEPLRYTVYIEDTRDAVGNHIQPGDKLYEKTNKAEIGTIQKVEMEPSDVASTDLHGNFVRVPSGGRYRVILTVDADVTRKDGHYYAGRNQEINQGFKYEMITKYTSFNGMIIDLQQ